MDTLNGYYKIISIQTHSFKSILQFISQKYSDNVVFKIDGCIYTEKDWDVIINRYGASKTLKSTIDFEIIRNGIIIYSFHDSTNDLFAHESELENVRELRKKHIIKRYFVNTYRRPKNIINKMIYTFTNRGFVSQEVF